MPITLLCQRRVARGDRLEFNGEPITSDAGAVLLREANRRRRLAERAAACVCDLRNQGIRSRVVDGGKKAA